MFFFNTLPNHNDIRFDERSHFARFRKHNMVFNATTTRSHCEKHVGCLSIKTVWTGEESYRFNGVQRTVTPGQFLLLNDEQTYSSNIDSSEKVKSFAVFFSSRFAAAVFRDAKRREELLLDNAGDDHKEVPEFFQQLYVTDSTLDEMLKRISIMSYDQVEMDEQLIFVLNHLLKVHKSEIKRSKKVEAVKPSSKIEIYRRLCIARDVLHSSYTTDVDLETIGREASMSVPQLVRQFKAVFNTTPHQYLRGIRLTQSARQLNTTSHSVQEIALTNGFENVSAFCRAFKNEFGVTPQAMRKK